MRRSAISWAVAASTGSARSASYQPRPTGSPGLRSAPAAAAPGTGASAERGTTTPGAYFTTSPEIGGSVAGVDSPRGSVRSSAVSSGVSSGRGGSCGAAAAGSAAGPSARPSVSATAVTIAKPPPGRFRGKPGRRNFPGAFDVVIVIRPLLVTAAAPHMEPSGLQSTSVASASVPRAVIVGRRYESSPGDRLGRFEAACRWPGAGTGEDSCRRPGSLCA